MSDLKQLVGDLKPKQQIGEEDIDIDEVSIGSENELLSDDEEIDEDDTIESGVPDDTDYGDIGGDEVDDDNGPDEEGKIELCGGGGDEFNDDNDNSDDEFEQDLKKFENMEKQSYIDNFHQNMIEHNEEEVKALLTVVRDKNNNIIDNLHKTLPILSKYEKSRILGIRASQINNGAQILVKQKIKTFDGYLIAQQELEEKKIPFIIKRPLPMGGGCEYWKLDDLEIV